LATAVNKTIGSAGGRDYSTATAYFAANGGATSKDLVSEDEVCVGSLYNDSVFNESWDTGTGWTCDSTRNLTLTVAAGERHDGTAGTGARFVHTGFASEKTTGKIPYSLFEWYSISYTNSSAGQEMLYNSATTDATTWSKLIFYDPGGAQAMINITGTHNSGTKTNYFQNIVLINDGSSTQGAMVLLHTAGGGTTEYYVDNCSLQCDSANVRGIHCRCTSGTCNVIATNCMVMDTTSADFYEDDAGGTATLSGDYNMDSDGTAVGGNSINNETASDQWENVASDLHLKAGNDAAGAGTNSPSSRFTDDIDGETRGSTWDMGADQVTAATTASIFYRTYRNRRT